MRAPALCFDVTDVVEYAMVNHTVTGIQRSVLNILQCIVRQNRNRPVYGLIKHPTTGQFKAADLEFMCGPYNLRDFALRFEIPNGKERWFARKLLKYGGTYISRSFRSFLLEIQWAVSAKTRMKAHALYEEAKPSCLMDLDLLPGSAIISLGAGWATDYAGVERLAKRNNCKVVSFVHDIFPVTSPQLSGLADRKKNKRFRLWLDHAARNSNLLICNSSYTKEQVEHYLARANITADVNVAAFPHEFKPLPGSQQALRREVTETAQSKFILCVGTIEVRKNIIELLHAWAAIQSTGTRTPQLVLAGRKGWEVRDVYEFLHRTAFVGKTVKIVDKPSDAELEFLYHNCEFTVFPSLFEGWGLPIGESLWFGKPVVCAANASMSEAGGKFATYFDHNKPGSLADAIQLMLRSPAKLPKEIRPHLTTWDGAANSILALIDRVV